MTKSKTTNQSKKIRRDLQALRAFAVVAVVLYHLWPERLVGGFTGVDIFFVLSGYLMTVSIMGRLNPLAETGTITVKNVLHLLTEFYARRIKRLVPAALATICGVLALATLSGNIGVLLTNAKNAISAATFWQNWFLANDSVNYLQQDNLIVATQHFWSLSVEEQFYLIWPLLLVVSTLITLNIVVLFKKQKMPGLILPLALITLLSLAYGVWLTQTDPTVAYYSTPARIWELMIGGIIALLPTIKNYDLKLLMPHVGLAACLYSIFFVNAEGFPGWAALIPTIGTAMIIWAGTDRVESKLAFDSMFRWRPIQWIGNISYSIYLWHWPLIILLPIILHIDINGPHGRLLKLGIIVLALIIAHLSYKYIEQSTQKLPLKTQYAYTLFAAATILVVALSFGLQRHADNQIQANLKSMHTAAMDESDICFGARAVLNQDKCGNPYGKTNLGFMSVAPSDDIIRSLAKGSCKYIPNSLSSPKFVNNFCIYGDEKSQRTIILFGDSHARQYINAFDYLGVKNGIKIILLDSIGCKGSNIIQTNDFCEQRHAAYERLLAHYEKSTVIISVLYNSLDFVKQHIDFIRKNSSGEIYLLKDNPRLTPALYSSCINTSLLCAFNRSDATDQNNSIVERLEASGVIRSEYVIDLDDAFCDKDSCYMSIGGAPVFHDTRTDPPYYTNNSHLTASYSYTIGSLLDQKLSERGIINY